MTKDDDKKFEQALRDGVGNLLAQVAAGEISQKEANRELDICKALTELIVIATELGSWPVSPEENMRRTEKLISLWPEACRRVGVAVMEMPTDIIRRIASVEGRPS